jgi:Ca-activated chloride channel family protein
MPSNVQLRYAFRLSPDNGSLKIGDNIPLGDISLDHSLSILMEFTVDSTLEEQDDLILTDGKLHMVVPTLPIPKTALRFTLSRKVAEDPKIEPPPKILVRAMSRLSLYRMQEKAQQELNDGHIVQATQRLKHLSQNLLASGEPELAHTVLLEIESMEKTQTLSESAQKQIKYGTRALVGKLDDDKEMTP